MAPKDNKSYHKFTFKLPIALHLYATFLIVILLMALSMIFISRGILNTYIAQECNRRFEECVCL